MINVFEDLLGMSGGDGDFIKGGLSTMPDAAEIHQIFEAWSRERGRSIECVLLMHRVRRLLSRLLAARRLTDQSEREVKSLLGLIDSLGSELPGIES